jgi:hypothetical protein
MIEGWRADVRRHSCQARAGRAGGVHPGLIAVAAGTAGAGRSSSRTPGRLPEAGVPAVHPSAGRTPGRLPQAGVAAAWRDFCGPARPPLHFETPGARRGDRCTSKLLLSAAPATAGRGSLPHAAGLPQAEVAAACRDFCGLARRPMHVETPAARPGARCRLKAPAAWRRSCRPPGRPLQAEDPAARRGACRTPRPGGNRACATRLILLFQARKS